MAAEAYAQTPLEQAIVESRLADEQRSFGEIYDDFIAGDPDGSAQAMSDLYGDAQATMAGVIVRQLNDGKPIDPQLVMLAAVGVGFAVGVRAERIRQRRDGDHASEVLG